MFSNISKRDVDCDESVSFTCGVSELLGEAVSVAGSAGSQPRGECGAAVSLSSVASLVEIPVA